MPPHCSSYLAPSDYYIFLSMANDFARKKFVLREACENRLSQFLPIGTTISRAGHYEITFKVSISLGTKRYIFLLNRDILTVLNITLNLMQK